ncbi:thiamine pyrophosphate-dependent dehydrogenase E1 component subunit alpha [Nocardioides alcanivorans]|uniref:thiamine pyrophosphate-dependent dehydrogenase E1 component subunit alpha n=1 Tax=Nocardioides alcanivorans TaxID=2897352 RepID=UPI001F2B7F9C|nr:thiamine pyrophosphate-dependent dehydrogenase E1 component subunit alpha [Nocardioides alcanivorans]
MSVHTVEDGIEAYRAMAVSRAIEQECVKLSGLWYPSIGEEAAIIGTFSSAAPGDVLYPHYRGSLVVQWMRGRPLEDIFRVMLHRDGAATKGRHAAPFDGHAAGQVMPFASIMLGPNIAMAAGAAWALTQRGQEEIAICAFGDGTAGTGDFHETLNMAAGLALPVVFVCQNNQFSISTPASAALSGTSVADWAAGYGIPSVKVDGNDLVSVADAVGQAVDHTRSERSPSFVELSTYRRTGHFAADPARYRERSDLERAEAADPIVRFAEHLTAKHGVDADRIAGIDRGAAELVAEALDTAKRDRELTAADLDLTGVYDR